MKKQRREPTYEEIAAAIDDALETALMTVDIYQEGEELPMYRLARLLDKAGLIDWDNIPRLEDDDE